MCSMPKMYIKVNLPLTEQEYQNGNGEGVWVKVDEETRRAYEMDAVGSGYSGMLANDSIYYPGLMCGTIITFEMRGSCRPVADYYGFLAGRPKITQEAKTLILMKIAKAQNGGSGT